MMPAHAVGSNKRPADPALEARARTSSARLRFLFCQNDLISEAHADLTHDIRAPVRERPSSGDSNAQVTQAIVDCYGAFVQLRPPVEPATYMRWFTQPPLLLGLADSALWLRRPCLGPALPLPLDRAKQQRLEGLLREYDE